MFLSSQIVKNTFLYYLIIEFSFLNQNLARVLIVKIKNNNININIRQNNYEKSYSFQIFFNNLFHI